MEYTVRVRMEGSGCGVWEVSGAQEGKGLQGSRLWPACPQHCASKAGWSLADMCLWGQAQLEPL